MTFFGGIIEDTKNFNLLKERIFPMTVTVTVAVTHTTGYEAAGRSSPEESLETRVVSAFKTKAGRYYGGQVV